MSILNVAVKWIFKLYALHRFHSVNGSESMAASFIVIWLNSDRNRFEKIFNETFCFRWCVATLKIGLNREPTKDDLYKCPAYDEAFKATVQFER